MKGQRWRHRDALELTRLAVDSIACIPQPDASLLNARSVYVAYASLPNDSGVSLTAAVNRVLVPLGFSVPLTTA